MNAPHTPEIGPVLQKHRKSRGLTLEQLAQLSGVSKSMLSQVERGQANPTFAVLWSLIRALRIDFDDLINAHSEVTEQDSVEVVSVPRTPVMRSADGMARLSILNPFNLSGSIEWYALEIDAGGVLDSAPHAKGTFEHFTAFTDGLEVRSGTTIKPVAKGETARYASDVSHHIANRSNNIARGLLVVFYR